MSKDFSINLLLLGVFFLIAQSLDNFWVHIAITAGLMVTAGVVTKLAVAFKEKP